MSLSRWKMMAGVLGVSIGGLAAAASQCSKWDSSKGRTPDGPVAKAEPKVPPAGAPSAPPALPELPLPGPAVPAAPQLVPAGPTPPAAAPDAAKPPALPLPGIPSAGADVKLDKPAEVLPAGAALPLPSDKPADTPKVPDAPKPADAKADAPKLPPELPKPADAPKVPDAPKPTIPPNPVDAGALDLIPPAPSAPPMKPTPTPPASAVPSVPPAGVTTPAPTPVNGGDGLPSVPLTPGKPTPTPPVKSPVVTTGGTQPPAPALPDTAPTAVEPPAKPTANVATPTPAPGAIAPALTAADVKFRILLRVGEGEPSFEVKNGDNLVLKVACEKVDIKSPEKGGGLSEVTAKGKVRFAGFGAEGSCDELKFFAGTGEVSMTGDVKLQVKDKLGRVESELTTATMKYKIDASAVGGALKP